MQACRDRALYSLLLCAWNDLCRVHHVLLFSGVRVYAYMFVHVGVCMCVQD